MHSWDCSVSDYQSFFISVFLEESMSSSYAWASLRCLNCNSSLVARRYLNTLIVSSRMFKSVIRLIRFTLICSYFLSKIIEFRALQQCMMHCLFSSFARAFREFDRFYFMKIISQFDFICSSLNDDCVFESCHSFEFFENILDELFDDSMNDSFNDNDSSNLSSFNFCANANFTFDCWDEYLRTDNDENQWISIWLSSFNEFFDNYVDCFIVEDFNVSENSINVNFSIELLDSSN
jgi:hypothetical protein